MTTLAEATTITVSETQLRITESDAKAALKRVLGESAVQARTRLRYGAGATCEPIARMVDDALDRAQRYGLDVDALVVSSGSAAEAEDIVRVRRKAHGVADWISTPTSDVTIVLQPKGLAALDEMPESAGEPQTPPAVVHAPENDAELAVREALYDVIDPDLGVNIVDLGFVRRVRLSDNGFATITMTLTSAACPLTLVMESQIRTVLTGMNTEFAVEWEWLPTWRPRDISDDGRDQLRAIGFSAF